MQSGEDTSGRGRPTKNRQGEIFNKMLECFGNGLSPPAAARHAGINVKTAYGYYNQIADQYKRESSEDVFEKHDKIRVQAIAAYDKDIQDATKRLDQIQKEMQSYIEKNEPVPESLNSYEIQLLKHRSQIKEKKAMYMTKPTFRELYQIKTVHQDKDKEEKKK